MGDLPKNVILSHINFIENYTFQIENEIQSMHWHSFQVTIVVHITYKINPTYIEDNGQNKVIKESHFYVNDDKEHDTFLM
jgi:hypothetical protein